jgi:hypothetical protein
MSELKPCPFCGSTSNDAFDHGENCYLRQILKGIPDNGVDLVALFAMRPIEDALQARIDELESEIKKRDDVEKERGDFLEKAVGSRYNLEFFIVRWKELESENAALKKKISYFERDCDNCKFLDIPFGTAPCSPCNTELNKWEPQP